MQAAAAEYRVGDEAHIGSGLRPVQLAGHREGGAGYAAVECVESQVVGLVASLDAAVGVQLRVCVEQAGTHFAALPNVRQWRLEPSG